MVEQLQGAFAENWLEATGVAIGGPAYFPRRRLDAKGLVDAQVVRSSPAGGSTAMYTMFLLALASARHSIHITNPYFVPDEKMIEHPDGGRAARRAVVSSYPGRHRPQSGPPGEPLGVRPPAEDGVKIYEYRPALLHAKTHGRRRHLGDGGQHQPGQPLVRAQRRAERRGLRRRHRAAARADLRQDLANSRRVSYKEWSQRGLTSRFLELLALPLKEQM